MVLLLFRIIMMIITTVYIFLQKDFALLAMYNVAVSLWD